MKTSSLRIGLVLAALLAGAVAFAQNITVTGTVIDVQTGAPVPGAAVMVQGTTHGVAAKDDGKYSITVAPDAVLVCTCFGYAEAVEKVASRGVVNFSLKLDTQMLDETVVVGYGTLKKSQLVGSVETVSGEKFEDRVNSNITRSLQGMVPGLNIIQSDGKPTHGGEIYIRGNSTSYVTQGKGGSKEHSIGQGGAALILIDGVEGDLSNVNPDDVESISVLKDASSSVIYGARAAYGVILVTTKNATNDKIKVSYNGSVTLNQRTVRWEDHIIDDGLSYLETFYDFFLGYSETPSSPGVKPDKINIYSIPSNYLDLYREHMAGGGGEKREVHNGSNIYFGGNYNYLEMFYKKMNLTHTHNLSVSGKSGKVSYLVSGRYYGQDGVYKLGNESFNSYNLRSKISIKATKTLTIDNNSSFSRNDYVQPIFTKGSGSVGTQLHQIAMAGFPVIPPTNEDGTYTIGAAASGYAAFADGNSSQAESRSVFSTTLGATWEPFKDIFKIRADFSYKNVNRDVDRYGASVEYSSAPGTTTHYVKPEDSYKRFFNYKSDYISANVVGTFTPKLGDNHNLNVVAGWNLEDYYYDRLGIVRNGLISNSNPNFELMEGPEVTLVNDGHSYGLVGFFGRANYTLFRRYIFELSARYDGSSKFPVNQQWGFFPSASFGWRISEEPWMSSAKSWLNNLKLRANAGSLGNGGISPFAYLSTMAVTKSGIAFDGALVNKVSDPTVVPDNLTWETVTTYDAGLDLDVLNSRLSFSGDYYIRNTTDLYINGPEIPAVFGETAPKGNYGALQTRGWELTLSWRDSFKLGGKDFTYSVKGSVWDSRTWVTKYYNETGDIYSYYEGKELGEIWGFRTDGLFKTNTEAQNWFKNDYHVYRPASGPYAGDVKFLDVDDNKRISIGDATLNSHGDLERIGNSMPRYQFGLNLDFKWNGIGISAFLQGVGKRDWYPISGSDFFWGGYARAYVAYALKSQSLENTAQVDKSTPDWVMTNADKDPYWPRRSYAQANQSQGTLTFPNDRYLQNAAYFRLKNLTIDYSFPKAMLKKAKIDQLKVYVTGENLFTWSPMFKHTDMFDPEVIQGGDSDFHDATTGQGYSYPMLRSFTFGINLTF